MNRHTPNQVLARTSLVLVALLLVAGQGPMAQASEGGGQGTAEALFVAPDRLTRLTYDPWLEGAWLGTVDAGLFFMPMDGEGLQWYGIREGLPAVTIHHIEATETAVWLGTPAGPVRLDKATQSVQPVLLENGTRLETTSRLIHAEGETIWIGTDDAGLYRTNATSMVAALVPNPVNGSSFEHPVLGMAHRGDELFISAAGYGLVRWDRASGEAEHYDMHLLWDKPNYGRVALTGDHVWVGTSGDGAIRYELASGEGHEYMGPETHMARHVFALVVLGEEVWFGNDAGVARYNTRTEAWTNWQSPVFPWGRATDIEVIQGQVHVPTKAGEVVRWDRASQSWKVATWWGQDQVPSYNVFTGCTTDDDALLFTTGGGGTQRYLPADQRWADVGKEEGASGEGPPGILHRAVAAGEDELWVGHQRGLSHYDEATRTWTDHRTDDGPLRRLPHNQVRDIILTPDRVWAGVFSDKPEAWKGAEHWQLGHVAALDRTTGEWTHYNTTHGLRGHNVTSLQFHGDWLYVTLLGVGVDRIDPATGTIEPVWSVEGGTFPYDLAVHDGTVWVADLRGLVAIDPDTLEAQVDPNVGDVPLLSLLPHDGALWLGTAGEGIGRYDLATSNVTWYRTGGPHDVWARCLTIHDGTLYVGTQWGVDRIDLSTGRLLSKAPTIRAFLQDRLGHDAETALTIDTPASRARLTPGEPLQVAGTARGPNGSAVEARVGAGPWQQAAGLANWTVSLDPTGQPTGEVTVAARLVLDGAVLGQTARTVVLAPPEGATQPPTVRHVPVLAANAGTPVALSVRVDPVPEGTEATLHLKRPDAATFEALSMAPEGSGAFTAELPAAEAGQTLRYWIEVTWPDGAIRFPAPDSNFGTDYRVVVQEVRGVASAVVSGAPTTLSLEPGTPITMAFSLQNAGNREATFQLTASGDARTWVQALPEPVTLAPASSQRLQLSLLAPNGTEAGQHTLNLTIAPTDPLAGTGTTHAFDLAVTAVETGGDGAEPPDEAPVPVLLLMLVVAAAALLRRRNP